jgi:transcription factor MYB, plant
MLSPGIASLGIPMSLLHTQQQFQQQHHVVKEESGSMIVFGRDQQSCSSWDSGCAHSQQQPQYGNGHGKELGFDGYLFGYNNGGSRMKHDNCRLISSCRCSPASPSAGVGGVQLQGDQAAAHEHSRR